MPILHAPITVATSAPGLKEITGLVSSWLHQQPAEDGILNLFIQHTSASLIIQENADPSARHDLEKYLNLLVPENQSYFQHTYEGADDMPAHIKTTLTGTSLTIPVGKGRLLLGTWQGIYLWEHRVGPHMRTIILSLNY